jgi:cell division protein FtsB
MPEDEVRGIAMEAKRGYEQQLRAQLESLRRENADLERDVAAADERARQIKQGVDAKVKALSELGAVADGLRGLGDV